MGGSLFLGDKKRGRDGLPRILRTPLSPFRHGFKRLRTDTAQMAVPTSAIIEQFDVIIDLGCGHLTSRVNAFLDPLLLQTAKERFGHLKQGQVWRANKYRSPLLGRFRRHTSRAHFGRVPRGKGKGGLLSVQMCRVFSKGSGL